MSFIYVKEEYTSLKEDLIKNGYRLFGNSNGFIIFENNIDVKFNFSKFDNSKFVFSNNLLF